MAEWPKWMAFDDDAPQDIVYLTNPNTKLSGVGGAIEVIPADLGQEMYKAFKMVDPDLRTKAMWDALTRYEREVGNSEPPGPEPFDVRQKARDRASEERIRRQER